MYTLNAHRPGDPHILEVGMRITAIALLIAWAAVSGDGHADEAGRAPSIGAEFHAKTSFTDRGIGSSRVHFGDSLPLYRWYPGADTVRVAVARPMPSSLDSTLHRRRSVRRFAPDALNFRDISTLLLASCGVTGRRGGIEHRPAPSAGALYPIDVYLMARRVEDLAPGLYHFRPRDSVLEFMRPGDLGEAFLRAANNQVAATDCPAALLIAARFDRSTHKYGDRGYRYTYMEAGAICQNVYLTATALGLGTVAIGAFNDAAANRLADLNGTTEAILLLMPLGNPDAP